MENKLPNGWHKSDIKSLCSITTGKKDVNEGNPDGIYPFFTCAQDTFKIDSFEFDGESILVAGNGFFNVKYYNGKFNAYQRTYVLQNFQIETKYIFYYITAKLADITKDNRGSTIRYIRLGDLADYQIPIPPLTEQHRIVAKLDALFEKIESNKKRLEKIPVILMRFRQSVLAAAVSGRLTEDWREKNAELDAKEFLIKSYNERLSIYKYLLNEAKESNSRKPIKPKELFIEINHDFDIPNSWVVTIPEFISSTSRHSLSIGPFGSNLKVSDYKDKGVPLVFVRHVKSNDFKNQNPKFVSKEKSNELNAHSTEPLDLLITKMGEPPGDCEIYPDFMPKGIITADILKFQVWDKFFNRVYFKHLINSSIIKEQLGIITQGVAQQKISLERFKTLLFPVPTLEEQNEIVKRIERLFSFADKLEDRYKKAKAMLDKLPQSILAKAFRGELVSQNPDDEPASVFLERIKEEKEKLKSVKKTLKKK